ncbi:phenol 2-monooxygenase [Rhynchosporium agropyri]|uniref:Phenol 2-monooxygenase n=1 Tax=Rhynchosporium agropyri TaxID=914238 RepID=A0A1E1JZF6_9HELO|nr:phenol 2-monooxygenase [Rhynchosporium agropyri]
MDNSFTPTERVGGKLQKGSNEYDIVIVGAGPVGLLLSTCLARWGYKIKHIDNRPEPTKTGRADGIQPRSLDLLRNMGLKPAIMAYEPAKVYEVAFWDPTSAGKGIQRTGTWASCPSFIDARYPFTTLLHQGMIERVFIADLEKNKIEIQRPWTITGFRSDEAKNLEYPVEVDLEHVDSKEKETVRAKYLFSGEGARSFVREQLKIGIKHKDPIAHVWGVMDGVVNTDFPDIKMKCTIHSEHGSIMVIPREDNMVRLYIQIASSTDKDWNPRKTASEEEVQSSAKRILEPYTIEWERVEWFSVYPIGQGIAEKYTLDHRVFMGGDACHTHSPKAGQGMNTAFLDAQNLAWKIHHVESGFADRSLLHSYESERKLIAENLLNFDAKYAALFSQRAPAAKDVAAATEKTGPDASDENEFIKTFKESCEFTSGYGVAYDPNPLNWSSSHPAQSDVINPRGNKLRTGRILINSNVTRVVDANVVHLEQEIPVNGSFKIYVFAGNVSKSQKALEDFTQNLRKKNSFFSTYLRKDIDTISHHERHNPHSHFLTFCTIFASKRSSIEISRDVPDLLARYRDNVYADDIFDQRVPDAKAAAHAKMGLDQESGGVVVVRPDGYVGIVTALTEGSGTVDALNQYFSAFCSKKLGESRAQL